MDVEGCCKKLMGIGYMVSLLILLVTMWSKQKCGVFCNA